MGTVAVGKFLSSRRRRCVQNQTRIATAWTSAVPFTDSVFGKLIPGLIRSINIASSQRAAEMNMHHGIVTGSTIASAINKALGRLAPTDDVLTDAKSMLEFLEWSIGDHLIAHKGKLGHFDFARAISAGRTLFVGEGNLSFSLALAKLAPRATRNFVVTTFEAGRRLSPSAFQNAIRLARTEAKILHGVDATRLDKYFSKEKFSAIIFNFQNVASRRPIYGHNPNHNLVRRFLTSAARYLTKDGQVIITVVDSPFYSGAFNLSAAAQFSGYKEPEVYDFKLTSFPGYSHVNTLGGQSALSRHRTFQTWVFRPL